MGNGSKNYNSTWTRAMPAERIFFYPSSRMTLCASCTHSKACLIALAHLQTQPPASFKIRRLEDFTKMKVLGCEGSEEMEREPEPGWIHT